MFEHNHNRYIQYPDHYGPKITFSVYQVRTYPSIYDLGVEVSPLGLENADVSGERVAQC